MEPMSDLSVLNLTPGQQVGGYTLVARLGGGAMGSVWSVTDDGGQMYAMKILRDSLNDQTDESDVSGSRDHDSEGYERVNARERLRREALALRKINHPGVCNIVDMELDDALAFIVTELIEGKTLRDDVAANGRYTGDDLERLSRKLMDAVRAVHAAGIVHRDIKPTNVMISSRGPVLVDFGIAMGAGESHVTRTGLVMGTPGFIAPEIIDGEESDAGADWWSTAAVLAFAATGKAVFGVKPMMAVLERAASGNADLSGLPTGTLTAFRKALAPKRQDRCSPDELLRAITLDAMVPELWQTDVAQEHQSPDTPSENSQAGDSGASNDANPSETAVMRPFGGSSSGTETLPALAGNTVPLEAER
ncbi:MAG: serine/threonine protein kinase, partial [Bifidobacterium crudilactis]|nr:serine/threonine protein kinase [Bifidobacterium crudilactis]